MVLLERSVWATVVFLKGFKFSQIFKLVNLILISSGNVEGNAFISD